VSGGYKILSATADERGQDAHAPDKEKSLNLNQCLGNSICRSNGFSICLEVTLCRN